MNNWEKRKLGDLVNTIRAGGTPSSTITEYYNGDIPFVSIEDITNTKKRLSKTVKHLSKKGLTNSSAWLIPNGYLIYSMYASVGKIRFLDIQAATSQAIIAFDTKEIIDREYLYYFLEKEEETIYKYTSQTTQANLSAQVVKNLDIYFPEKLHQQKIAKILSTIDTVIEKTENAIAKYQAIKKGMMHDLFTRGIDFKTGQLRPSFKEAPKLYKESALGMIPKDWELKPLSKLTNLITDGAHFSPVPQEDGLPIGNVKDMTAYGLNYSNCTLILKETFELLERQNCSPKIGDVLLSKDGTIGRVILFNDSRPIVLLSSIAIIRTNDLISGEYLSSVLQSFYFDKELFKLVSGSALKRITLKDIQKINIPYPTNEKEQPIIFSKLKIINALIQKEQEILAKHQKIKKGLMQDLLTGKVEVKV